MIGEFNRLIGDGCCTRFHEGIGALPSGSKVEVGEDDLS